MSSVRLTLRSAACRASKILCDFRAAHIAVAAAGNGKPAGAALACGALFAHVPNAALAELMLAPNAVPDGVQPAASASARRQADGLSLLSAKLDRERALSACIWAGRARLCWLRWRREMVCARTAESLARICGGIHLASASDGAPGDVRTAARGILQSTPSARCPSRRPRRSSPWTPSTEVALRSARPDRGHAVRRLPGRQPLMPSRTTEL